MLYNLLAFCFVSHLNNTPKPDSSQEPGFVFRGCLFMRQPRLVVERDNPNKNYVCFIGGFALMLDIQKIRA